MIRTFSLLVSSIYNAKQRKDYIQGLGEKLPDKNKRSSIN